MHINPQRCFSKLLFKQYRDNFFKAVWECSKNPQYAHTHTLHCMTFKAKLTHEQTDLMRSRHPSKDKSKQGRTLPRLQRDPEPHLNCTPQSASPFIRAQSLASADLSARQRAASLMSSCLCVLLLLLQLITSRAADECRCPDLHKHLKSSLKSHFYGLAANAR